MPGQGIDIEDGDRLIFGKADPPELVQLKAKVYVLFQKYDREWPYISADEAEAAARKLGIPESAIGPIMKLYLTSRGY